MSDEKIVSYKGFTKDWKCRDFQFAVGETYTHDGTVLACESGFHACEYPLNVFCYYSPADSNFGIVEQSGGLSREGSDTKVASKTITVKASIDFAGLVSAAIEYTRNKCDPANEAHATGYRSASSATGYRSASSATGDQSTSSATGDQSTSSATGDRSASSATGDQSASSATGDRSASSATGDQSASSATGDQSASSATGDQSASSATGDQSASSATGDRSASSATGDRSASEITPHHEGKSLHAVAAAYGESSKARAPKGSAIVCVYRNYIGELVHIRASKVGENGVKAGVWYTLDCNGEFVEV